MVNNLGLITGIANSEKMVTYRALVIEMQKPALRLRSASDPDGGDTKSYSCLPRTMTKKAQAFIAPPLNTLLNTSKSTSPPLRAHNTKIHCLRR